MRLASLLLLFALALPVVAQPSAGSVLDAWRDGWERASGGLRSVDADERTEWTVDGPRGRTVVEGEARVRFGDGPTERDVERTRVNGRTVDASRGRGQAGRWQRAFGPAGREVHAAPRLPDSFLFDARPLGIAADRIDGVAAWRVTIDTRTDRAEAWFSRSDSPRLLSVRAEGRRPRGGRFVREIRYVRVGGLDVPAESRTTLTVQQRRRLREYFVTLTAVGAYSGHTLR